MAKREGHTEYMREWRARKHQELIDNPDCVAHGTKNAYSNYGCRCDKCIEHNNASKLDWLNRGGRQSPGTRAVFIRGSRKYRNAGPGVEASNRRKQWTGAEMAIATERDEDGKYLRTVAVVAEMLGRSRTAVDHMRAKCLRDPKYQRVVGSQVGHV